MSIKAIAASLTGFLTESPDTVVLEDGEVLFDLSTAHHSCTEQNRKCLLRFWSDEKSTCRRVVDSEIKDGVLRLTVHRLGQMGRSVTEISRERDWCNPQTNTATRPASWSSGGRMKFLLGLSVGIGLGLLFAPRSGEETRRELRARAEELERHAMQTGREKAGELGRAGERLFDKAVGDET